jgi:hypothetical protein
MVADYLPKKPPASIRATRVTRDLNVDKGNMLAISETGAIIIMSHEEFHKQYTEIRPTGAFGQPLNDYPKIERDPTKKSTPGDRKRAAMNYSSDVIVVLRALILAYDKTSLPQSNKSLCGYIADKRICNSLSSRVSDLKTRFWAVTGVSMEERHVIVPTDSGRQAEARFRAAAGNPELYELQVRAPEELSS